LCLERGRHHRFESFLHNLGFEQRTKPLQLYWSWLHL
jgi:hypothetical protein